MTNPYLAGNYAPVSQERTLTELEVTGSVPEHLDGRYLRNGPNPISEIDPATYHWFAGDGMVHGVRLRDGRAEWYRNRWVRSRGAAAALAGSAPSPSRLAAGNPGLGANTNVIAHAGRTLALVEAGVMSYELTDELDTVGPCDFDGTLDGGFTAHPKRDPATGELHAVSYHLGRGRTVQYSVIGTDGRARRTVDIEVTGSPMMHDLALTERHVVFLDLPVVFDPTKGAQVAAPPWLHRPAQLVLSALAGRIRVPDPIFAAVAYGSGGGRNADMPYSWDPTYPARIGLMPREGTNADVRWFDIDPCYVFHTLGAFDDTTDGANAVVVDAARHQRMFTVDRHGPDGERPRLHRWRLDLAGGRVTETELDGHGQEFPRADERRLGHRHRYAYTVTTGTRGRLGDIFGSTVLRHDLEQGTTTQRTLDAHAQLGEFVFVPRAEDAGEEDGVLMGFVYDADTDRSRLSMLDAASLDTLAEVHLPTRIPHGFHGNWLPSD